MGDKAPLKDIEGGSSDKYPSFGESSQQPARNITFDANQEQYGDQRNKPYVELTSKGTLRRKATTTQQTKDQFETVDIDGDGEFDTSEDNMFFEQPQGACTIKETSASTSDQTPTVDESLPRTEVQRLLDYISSDKGRGQYRDPIKSLMVTVQNAHKKSSRYVKVGQEVRQREQWDPKVDRIPANQAKQYQYLRYTPIASYDPKHMIIDGYKPRLALSSYRRKIRLFICVTLYNENWVDVNKSLEGCFENIDYLAHKGVLPWNEVAIAFIQDGIGVLHPQVRENLIRMGLFYEFDCPNAEHVRIKRMEKEQRSPEEAAEVERCVQCKTGLPQASGLGEFVHAHMFERTIRRLKPEGGRSFDGNAFHQPAQVIWLSKTKNMRKLSSHAWFFHGLCDQIKPEVVVLLDAGARPQYDAFYHLFLVYRDQNVGAAGGELMVEWPRSTAEKKLKIESKFLGHVQYMEWKFAYIFDVPFQHLCGYIQVLPGAFSSYRYDALVGQPLKKYFRGYYEEESMRAFKRNVYLAEDRILCIEIVAKKDSAYRLAFVKDSKCTADHMETLGGLLGQRRRWLNGSFFAALYAFAKLKQIWRTNHSMGRKTVFSLEFLFLGLNLLVSSVLGVGFLFTFIKELVDAVLKSVLVDSLAEGAQDSKGNSLEEEREAYAQLISTVVMGVYAAFLLLQLILALNNKPKNVQGLHWLTTMVFGVYQYAFLILTGWFLVRDFKQDGLEDFLGGFSLASIAVITLVVLTISLVILHGQVKAFCATILQYWFVSGAYVNILQVFAFTNSHDLTWGTKGVGAASEAAEANKQQQQFDSIEQNLDSYRDIILRRMDPNHKPRVVDAEQLADTKGDVDQEYRVFSTRLILTWLVANGLLLYSISALGRLGIGDDDGTLGELYVRILLIALSLLRVFQLLVSACYIIRYRVKGLSDRKRR